MAKNTVTEQDLLSGVGGLGSFGSLGSGKPQRDNPFRHTQQAAAMAPPQPFVDRVVVTSTPVDQPDLVVPVAPSAAAAQQLRPKVGVVSNGSVPSESETTAVAVTRPKKEKKADRYGEKMSTFLSREMRDDLTMTARMLNSNRLVKGDPITAHSLLRCGVRVITELIEFSESDMISSEDELYALVKKKLKGAG